MKKHSKALDSTQFASNVDLDRVCISAAASDRKAFRDKPGHKVRCSHFLRSGAYSRLLETEDTDTGATTLVYDNRRVPWVPETKVTIRAGDSQGLQPADLLGAFELLNDGYLSLLEVAFDFDERVKLNTGFVLGHVLFAKSRWSAPKPCIVWFGARRSSKFVRAYQKPELGVFRVELEFHASWLRHHGIRDCFDFLKIPNLVLRRHIFFCQLDWAAVIRKIRCSVPNARLALRNLEWQRDNPCTPRCNICEANSRFGTLIDFFRPSSSTNSWHVL
ncbi:MAG TPA: hypothetical protein VKB40_11095 [Candidatus Acidoferrales bacterium]|nr:hypothetical protein [Candidatus Acidoferrales bacterium]